MAHCSLRPGGEAHDIELRIAIVGAGISGLSAAYYIHQLSPDSRLYLIDQGDRPGGKIATELCDGFVMEMGADSFLTTKPQAIALCRDLGIEEQLQETKAAPHRSYIHWAGKLHELPEGLSGLIPGNVKSLIESDLFSPEGKRRLRAEVDVPAAGTSQDESLADFIERRFGLEAYERLIEPLLSGIYAGDGRELSAQATFPQLKSMEDEYGSLVLGSLARQSAQTTRSPFVAPRAGMEYLVRALAAHLQAGVFTPRTLVGEVSRLPAGYRLRLESGQTLEVDAVILATPAFAAADLVQDLDGPLAGMLRSIPYVSTSVVTLGYREEEVPRRLDAHGYLVPQISGRPLLACTWTSSKFDHRAPEGYALLRAFMGRAGRDEVADLPDPEMGDVVRAELREVLGIRAAPVVQRICRWPRGMPQYTLGHLERISGIEDRLLQLPGLALAGSAYRGVGIPDCIQSGKNAAEHILLVAQRKNGGPDRI